MKAAWIRNFWTKTVAFLLAAALVPRFNNYRHLLIGGIINRRSKLHSPHLLSSIPQFLQKMKWQIESDAVRLFIPKTHRCKQRVQLPPYPLHTTNQ